MRDVGWWQCWLGWFAGLVGFWRGQASCLLKCVLGFRMLVFLSFLRIAVFFCAQHLVFPLRQDAFCVHIWHPGEPVDEPGALGSTRKETLGSRFVRPLIWGWFLDHICRLFGYIGKNGCLVKACSFVAVQFVFDSESAHLGLRYEVFGVRCVAISHFSQQLEL